MFGLASQDFLALSDGYTEVIVVGPNFLQVSSYLVVVISQSFPKGKVNLVQSDFSPLMYFICRVVLFFFY